MECVMKPSHPCVRVFVFHCGLSHYLRCFNWSLKVYNSLCCPGFNRCDVSSDTTLAASQTLLVTAFRSRRGFGLSSFWSSANLKMWLI